MKCKNLWTWLLFLMACSLAIPSEAQTTMDISPSVGKRARMAVPSGVPGLRAGTVANQPILYSFYTSVGGTPAIESDGKYFYSTAWRGVDGYESGTFWLYDNQGKEVSRVVVPDGGNVRDLTTDGRYFYGGQFRTSSERDILKMDIKTGTLIERIPVVMKQKLQEIRHCTYDPGLDGGNGGFWIGGWSEMAAVSMTGEELIPNISGATSDCYGVGLDRVTDPSRPRLLMFRQIESGSQVEIHGFDILTQKPTGLVRDMWSALPAADQKSSSIAGGLTTYEENGKLIVLGNVQCDKKNWIFAYELATVNNNTPAMPKSLTVKNAGSNKAELRWTNPSTTKDGRQLSGLLTIVVRRNGNVVQTINNASPGASVKWTESGVSGTNSTYMVHAVNQAGAGEPIYVTGYKELKVWGSEGWYDKTWYAANTGTSDVVIKTAPQLAAFAKRVNEGKNFEGRTVTLQPESGNEISLAGAEWIPIGKSGSGFAGIFDGQGYQITGLSISDEVNYPYIGLFGKLSGTVRNVSLVGKINALVVSGVDIQVGSIAGYCSGVIEMCASRTGVKVTGLGYTTNNVQAGGVAGCLDGGTLRYCYNVGDVEADGLTVEAGGVVGRLCGGASQLMSVYSAGRIQSPQQYRQGGVAGYHEAGTVKKCYYNKEKYAGCGGLGKSSAIAADVPEQAEGKTTTYMKSSLISDLNYARFVWMKDITVVNEGYPLLSWQDVTVPQITTLAANAITVTGATLKATVKAGTMPLTGQGFEWKDVAAASYIRESASLSSGSMSKSITGLSKGKKYVFRAYATTLVEGETRYNYGEDLSFVTASPLAAGIRCVKPLSEGKGDGSSWENASSDLQGMINASGVTEVWIAAGCYKPDSKDRKISFNIPTGKKVYGGFRGTESSVDERNLYANRTVLSGDIGLPNNNSDNTYHVVQMTGGLLDGVTVTGGNANASFSPGWDGGGVYMSGNSELRNCIVLNNQGGVGGGVFLNSNAKMYNCLVTNNRSVQNPSQILGAGLHFESGGYAYYCTITNNMSEGSYGGISQKGGNLVGCVVWNNYPSQISAFGYGNWTQSYCAVEGEVASGTNISLKTDNRITGGPNFIDPSVNNYYFTGNSPLGGSGENAGTSGRAVKDIFGIAYPSSGKLPIGAFCGDGSAISRLKAVVTVESKTYAYEKGKSKNVTVTTHPADLRCDVEYRDRSGMLVGAPEAVGTYDVVAVVNEIGYEGRGTGVLKIVESTPKAQKITWEQSKTELEVGMLAVKLGAVTDADGLKVSYYSENPNVVRVEQKGEDWYAFALAATGTANICAYQNGSESYLAAQIVKKIFTAVEVTNPQLPVPDVTTCQASAITGTSAVLNGLVVPGALSVSGCGFEWKKETATDYLRITLPVGGEQVSAPVSGLTPGAYYMYRTYGTVVRDGVAQTVYGTVVRFRALAVPTITVTNGTTEVGVYTTWDQASQAIAASVLPGTFTMTIDGEITESGTTPEKPVVVTGGSLRFSSAKVIARSAVTYRNIEFLGDEVSFFASGNELIMGSGVVFALRSSYSVYGGKDADEGVEVCALTVESGNWKKIIAGGRGEKATVKEAKIKISGGNVVEVDAGALVSSWLTVEGTPAIGELKRIHLLRLNNDLSLEKGVEFKAPAAAESEVRIRKDKKLTVTGTSVGSAKVTIVYDTDEVARLTQSDNGTVVIVDTAAAVDAFILTNELKQLKKNISTGEYTIEDVTALSVMHLSTANNGHFELQLAATETITAQLDNSRQPKDISVTAAGNNYSVDMGGTGAGVVKVVVSAENAAKINRIVVTGSGADALDVKYASGLKELELRNAALKSLVLPEAKDKLNSLVLDTCGLLRLEQVADYTALTNLSVRGNKLTFATLPEKPVGAVATGAFLYAPQDTVIAIPAGIKLDGNVDLSSQQRNAGGGQTVYTWKTRTTGKTLVAGTDYTEKNGVFKFEPVSDSIYCEMTHPAWAGLVLRTNCTFVTDPSKEEQYIVFNELGTVSLSAALLSLKATASSGLEVGFVSLDESVAEINGNVLSLRKAGEVRIMAVQPGNDLVNVASPVVRLLKIKPLANDPGKTSQTITFDELQNISQDKGVLALTATSSAGLEIRYVSSDESVAMVEGNKLVLHKAGTVMIAATQEGNETVNEAVPVSRQLIVEAVPALPGKSTQTIDFEEIGKIPLKAAMVSLSAVSSADLPVSLVSSNPDVASVFGSTLLLHKAGTVTIIATQPGDAAYNAAPALTRTVEIVEGSFPDKQNQVLAFDELGTKKLSVGIWPLSATSSLGLAVTYRSSDAAVAEVSGNSLVLRTPGRVTIAATQPGNDTVNVAVPVFRELIVEADTKDPGKQDQTLTFDELGTKKQSMGILPLSATSSRGLAVTYQSSNAAVAEVSGNSLVLHATGYAMIVAVQPGNDMVNPADPVFRELIVEADLKDPDKKDQEIVFNLPAQQNRGDKQIQLTATASSGLPVTFISSDTKTASVSGSTLSLLKAGKVWVTAVQEGNDEWNKALVIARLLEIGEAIETPGQGDQTITFDLPASVNLGRRTIQLSATASSGLPVLYVSDDPAIASVSGSTLTLLQAGTVSLAAIQMGDNTWKAAVTEIRPLTILADSTIDPAKKDQTITFSLPLSVNQAVGSIQLTATASSGLPLTYASSNPEMATVSGSTLTLLKSGTVVITAFQAGNDEWNAAESMTRMLMIETDSTRKPTKQDQTITFDLPLSVNQCVSSVPLTATAVSGLPVTFVCSNPEMATVSGDALTSLKPGILVITALQPGNTVWNAAEPITRMLMIEADTTKKPTKQDQAITFDLPLSVSQSVNSVPLTGTTTSGLPVAYVSSNPEIATVTNNTLTLLKVGTVVITAFQKGDKDWNAAEPVTHTLIVKPNEQTVVFELSSPVNQGAGPLALSATATSGLPVVFSSSDPEIASVSGTTLSLLKPGTVTITASQPGGGNWLEAESVARELVIEKNGQNITFELPSPVILSTGVLELTAKTTSGLPVSFSSSNTAVAMVSDTTLILVKAGTVTITASQPGRGFWAAATPVSRELVVGKTAQTIAFELVSSVKQSVGTLDLSATATSGLPVVFKSSDETIASVVNSTLTLLKSGTVTITASQSGNDGWAAATSVSHELVIEKEDQTMTFELASPVKLSAGTLSLSATATSGLAVVFNSSDETIASVTGNTLTLLKPGTVTITASQPGDENWNAATSVSRELMIEKGEQGITFELASPVKLSAGTLSLSATATSGLAVVFNSSDETIASVTGNTLTLLKSGTVTITASQPGDENWNAATSVSRELMIEKGEQGITFELASPVKLSAGTLALSATATSGLAVVFNSSDETIASVTGSTLTLLKPGTVTITASQPGDENWNAATSVSRELMIEKDEQGITFELASPVKLSAGTLALSATATSGLAVVFNSSDETIASVAGSTLTLLKRGTVTITASQPGDENWNAATPVSHELVIEGNNDQTITFVLSSPVKSGVGTLSLSATATSGLPVAFSSSDESIASVSGTTLTLLKIGTVTITASQVGNDRWNPAQQVTQTLVIEKSSTVIPPNPGEGSVTVKDDSGKEYGEDDVIPDGTEIILTPKPEDGYEFVEWSDGNTDNPRRLETPLEGDLTPMFKKAQRINFTTFETPVKVGAISLELKATATSGLPVVFRSSDERVASISGNTLTLHAAGTVVITASQAGDETWNKAPEQPQTLIVEQSFVIIAPDPEIGKINIRDIGGKEYAAGTVIPDGTQVTVSVETASEWVFVGWSDGNNDYPRTLTFPIDADLNANFKHLQNIDFNLVQYVTLGETEAIDLNAVASSGLVVEYESSDPVIAEVRSGQLIPLVPGQLTVTARQAGNDEWMPAEEVVRTVVILPGVPDMDVVNVVEVRGDNNTKFLIKNFELYSVVKLKLMNIQGKVVYRSDHYDNNLDMRDFSRGAYYYVIEATLLNGRHEVLKGGMEVIK